jgi:hypothetical protein
MNGVQSVSAEEVEAWRLDMLSSLFIECYLTDILTADECGLLFTLFLDNTCAFGR